MTLTRQQQQVFDAIKEFMDSEVMEKAIASGEAVETNWNNY